MRIETLRKRLRKKFPEGLLVQLKPRAIPRPYIPVDGTFRVGNIGKVYGNIFVTCEEVGVGFFVSPRDIIIIKEKVVFT